MTSSTLKSNFAFYYFVFLLFLFYALLVLYYRKVHRENGDIADCVCSSCTTVKEMTWFVAFIACSGETASKTTRQVIYFTCRVHSFQNSKQVILNKKCGH